MTGLCTIVRTEDRFGRDETVEVPGIRFKVN